MILPAEIQQWYADALPRLQLIERRVKGTLENFTSKKGFIFKGRIKGAESLSEKIDIGRTRGLSEVDDAYAGTVIVPTYSYEAEVRAFLAEVFSARRVIERGSGSKPPDGFRFDSTRVYCSLSDDSSASQTEQIVFEIQILSAMDFAWQMVTHDLVYKHAVVDWRRARAAAEMKAAVEQLDQIGEGFDTFVPLVRPAAWPEVDAKNEITTRLDALFSSGRLPEELMPQAMSRVADMAIQTFREDDRRPRDFVVLAQSAMDCLGEYIASKGNIGVPRSLTLSQLVFGVMYRYEVVSRNVRQVVLINDALSTEFPELRTYRYSFALD